MRHSVSLENFNLTITDIDFIHMHALCNLQPLPPTSQYSIYWDGEEPGFHFSNFMSKVCYGEIANLLAHTFFKAIINLDTLLKQSQ